MLEYILYYYIMAYNRIGKVIGEYIAVYYDYRYVIKLL